MQKLSITLSDEDELSIEMDGDPVVLLGLIEIARHEILKDMDSED